MNTFTPAVLCALLVAFILAAPLNKQSNDANQIKYRLDGSIEPINYEIFLTPYILPNEGKEQFTFEGKVIITLKALRQQKEIVLHANGLTFKKDDIKLTKKGDSTPSFGTYLPSDPEADKVELRFNNPLDEGKEYNLEITYTGNLGNNMQGFYRSYYKKPDGQIQWLASTHFQTHHARKAFPCFDEPKYKATFKIEINHHKSLTAVSNTKVEGDPEEKGERKITKFKRTPKMSTYLVAFLVSDFTARKIVSEDPDFSIIARAAAYDQTEYSYNIGRKLLAKMDDYFGLKYKTLGNEKMDLAAIPDFSAGAMENWGLITYRERALLYDRKTTTANYEQSVAGTIAHEQVHMWFGDYVTCEWWGYTWLNEGFARYFQYYILGQINADWEMEQQFIVDQIQVVFKMDSLPGTHELSKNTVATPIELRQMFNSISYNKGASIIRMISYILGKDRFQTAIKAYLVKYGGKTATPENLFDEFDRVLDTPNINLRKVLVDFTTKIGYPVVHVKLNEDKQGLMVKQKRFVLDKSKAEDTNILYTIPFTYATDTLEFSNTKPVKFLEQSHDYVPVPLSTKTNYVIANVKQTGYYRVNYDETLWHAIHDVLEKEHEKVDVMNRAQIVDDLFNLARADDINYKLALDILEYLRHETDYLPWAAAFNGFSDMEARIGKDHVELFGKHILRLTDKVFKKLGFEAENDKRLDIYNRVKVLTWACKYGNKDCITTSLKLFKGYKDNEEQVKPDIRHPVYCTGIREGGRDEFISLWKKYLSANVASEQVIILNTLACTKDKETVQLYLNYIISNDIRLQDKSSTLTALYKENLENVDVVFEFVIQNYRSFVTSFGDISDVAIILSGIANRFTTKEQVDKLKNFVNIKSQELGPSSTASLYKAIETAESNLKWSENIVPHFMDILKIKNNSAVVQNSLIVTITLALVAIILSH